MRILAKIRFVECTVYRRLFTFVFLANLTALIIIMTQNQKLLNFVNAAAANLLVSGLARHPFVVNSIFQIICSIPRSAPLCIRRVAAKVFHYGGVHSGSGVAALLWYIGFVGLLSKDYPTNHTFTPTILALAYLILALLLAIVAIAYPKFRLSKHDYFELTHRFGGWLVTCLFWPLLLLFAKNARQQPQQQESIGHFLINLPAFWLLLATSFAIIHPWLYLRKVDVIPEPISPHAIRLHFDHTSISFGQGLAVSRHPLRDWHSFATFPDPNGKSFSCLVSKAGDWTARCIAEKPTQLWKRGVPMYGFVYAMRMFTRVVVVTTGSGMGPCLSFLGDADRPLMRVLWQTKAPLKTYGQGVLDLVARLDANARIVDTTRGGRREMLPMALEMVQEFAAEAVCVISNPVVTKHLVAELEARGMLAYGPIFDS